MRVAVVGAGGGAGPRVARDLSEHRDVSKVEFVSAASSREEFTKQKLRSVISRADVAIGCLGGDTAGELVAAEAAIAGGVPYLSSCEGMPAMEALESLGERAGAAGVLIVPGLGLSPGLTNVLSIAASGSVAKPARIEISWVVSSGGELGSHAFSHALRALSGPVPVFKKGAWHRSSAGSAGELICFPEPVGWRRVHLCEGAEVLTLPRAIPSLEEVVVKGGVTEPVLDRAARSVSQVVSRSSSAQRILTRSQRMLPWIGRLSGAGQTWSALRVEVTGSTDDGKAVSVILGIADQFANLASAPLVAGALMVAAGQIKGSGVCPVETVVSPGEFFISLAKRGVKVARLHQANGI